MINIMQIPNWSAYILIASNHFSLKAIDGCNYIHLKDKKVAELLQFEQ